MDLLNSAPVAELSGYEFLPKGGKTFIQQVLEFFELQGGQANSPFGVVIFRTVMIKDEIVLLFLPKRNTLSPQQHRPNPTLQTPLPLAIHIVKMQQSLRLHGIFRFDATLGEMADDGIVLGFSLFQELNGRLTHRFVLV